MLFVCTSFLEPIFPWLDEEYVQQETGNQKVLAYSGFIDIITFKFYVLRHNYYLYLYNIYIGWNCSDAYSKNNSLNIRWLGCIRPVSRTYVPANPGFKGMNHRLLVLLYLLFSVCFTLLHSLFSLNHLYVRQSWCSKISIVKFWVLYKINNYTTTTTESILNTEGIR